jgi:hypothetical protein
VVSHTQNGIVVKIDRGAEAVCPCAAVPRNPTPIQGVGLRRKVHEQSFRSIAYLPSPHSRALIVNTPGSRTSPSSTVLPVKHCTCGCRRERPRGFDLGTASFDTDLRICHSARFAKWIMRVVAQTIGDYIGVGVLIVDSVSRTAARLGTLIRAAAPEKPTNDHRELRRSTDISTAPSPSHLALL